MEDDCYEHFKDDCEYEEAAMPAAGYDSNNGLRTHVYIPANYKEPSVNAALPPQQMWYGQGYPVQYVPAQQVQSPYAYAPQPHLQCSPYPYAYPAQPMYQANGYAGYAGYPGPGMYYCQPAAPPPQQKEEKKAAKHKTKEKPMEWQGRKASQVDEDNMRIAARAGAYKKRKVEPIDMQADQMVWVVELDGGHTLRAYGTIKHMKGEWKADPRFEGSYYFIREE